MSIRGVDFGFEGVPASVPAGTNRITFDNGGNELHEVVILRLPDGMSLAEALELPDEESDEFFYSGLVGTLYAQPGEAAAASLTATLSPGTYGLICFIENAEGPHAFQGMHAELVASP